VVRVTRLRKSTTRLLNRTPYLSRPIKTGIMKKLLPLMLFAATTYSCKTQKTMAIVNPGLTNTYWKLTELNGRPITSPDGKNTYFLRLDEATGRVNAYAGCNRMMGSFTHPDSFRLSFGKMASTMMACPDMSLETEFARMLETVDNYAIADNALSLNKARMAPLARFVAIPEPK